MERKQTAGIWHVQIPCATCGQPIWVAEKTSRYDDCCTRCYSPRKKKIFDTGGGVRVVRKHIPEDDPSLDNVIRALEEDR